MVLVDFNAPRSQPHGEELFEFCGVELPVDDFIDHGTDLQPLRHDTVLAYPVTVFLFLRSLSALQNHGSGILYSFAAFFHNIFCRSFGSTPSKLLAKASWV